MVDIREYGCLGELKKEIGVSADEIVEALESGKTGLVYGQDYRWAIAGRNYRYTIIAHIETCVKALKEYFSKEKNNTTE